MTGIREVGIRLAGGVVGSLAFFTVAYLLFPKTVLTTVWITAGIPLGTLLAYAAPESLRYQIDGEGGPVAFLAFVLVGAFLTWTAIFATLFAIWQVRYRRPRPAI